MVLAWALRGNFMGRMTVLQRSLGGTVTCADALCDRLNAMRPN